jgi:hypothetical protein
MKTTYEQLDDLDAELASGAVPTAKSLWGGADVMIRKVAPRPKTGDSFYPEPRVVVTEHAGEISWMFEKLRDAFYSEDRLDGCSKIEFFGRLANAVLRAIAHSDPPPSGSILCAAVLHEAYAIYDEMEEGTFEWLAVAVGNEIVDDYVDDALRTGFIGTEDTIAFFRERGVEVAGA